MDTQREQKEQQEQEVMPFEDVIKRLLNTPPKPKTPKGKKNIDHTKENTEL